MKASREMRGDLQVPWSQISIYPKRKPPGRPRRWIAPSPEKPVNAYRQDADKTDGLFFAKPLMREALETTLSNAGDTPFI